MDEPEDDGVGEEGQRVEYEQDGERARVRDHGDQAADDPAQADPEVHRQALLRERGMATRGGGEARDERRLARPESGRADPFHREEDERLPRLADEGEEAEADGLEGEAAAERQPRADPVDHDPGGDARTEQRRRGEADDQAGRPEREAAHVVQVDDEEREHDPVPEGVDHPADLEQPHLPGQLRIEPPEQAAGDPRTLAHAIASK